MKDFMKLVSISHIPTQHNRKLCCGCKQWKAWIPNQPFNYGGCHSSLLSLAGLGFFFFLPLQNLSCFCCRVFKFLPPNFPENRKFLWNNDCRWKLRQGKVSLKIESTIPSFLRLSPHRVKHSEITATHKKGHIYRFFILIYIFNQISRVIYIYIVLRIESRTSHML